MYLLADADEERVEGLKTTLDGLGDSLLVVGGPDLWNVHVHVDDAGAALEAGVAAGRPYRVKVTHFADHPRRRPATGVAVVACAAGPGLAAIFEDSGATVVSSGPGRRASAGQLLEAAREAHALTVILLPNDRTPSWPPRRPPTRPSRRASTSTSCARARRCRASPRWPSSTPSLSAATEPRGHERLRLPPPGTARSPSPAARP